MAQAALAFKWEGDADGDDAKEEAFVRYARMRVKGAMLDELRQMDHLGRGQRRKIKIIQIARERWRASHAANPSLAELSAVCGIGIDEIARLDHDALTAQSESLSEDADAEDHAPAAHPATPHDEVEARVDTAIVMRRLEKFFAGLPERHRQVIDSYLGVGLTPIELASALKVSPSRVSQLYRSVFQSIARHFGHAEHRSTDRLGAGPRSNRAQRLEELVAAREAELAAAEPNGRWDELMEEALTMPTERFGGDHGADFLKLDGSTRWG